MTHGVYNKKYAHYRDRYHIDVYMYRFRGGSRIPRRRGCQPSRRRAPVYKFARFSEKLHEIKKMLVRRGAPPLDQPLQLQSGIQDCVCMGGGVHARRACTRSTNDNGFQTRSGKNVLGVLSLESILPHCV